MGQETIKIRKETNTHTHKQDRDPDSHRDRLEKQTGTTEGNNKHSWNGKRREMTKLVTDPHI